MSLVTELRRRNVFRVAAAYLVAGWLLVEATTVLMEIYGAPVWVPKMLVGVIALGFPVALFFSWAFEITPEGIKRESEVDRSASVTHDTARRLDIITIVLLVLAVGLLGADRLLFDRAPAPTEADGGQRSIAVLPFVNMSADPENEYFADGLSEELLNKLAQVPDLRVAGRTSSFQFKGENLDLRAIGEQLGVGNVLEGSVRKSGDTVRITAQLIDASDGSHLWSDSYDRTLEDVFAIQDEIATEVVGALDIVLDEKARQRMLNAGVRNVDAFVAYQRGIEVSGRAHGSSDVVGELAEAASYFDQAIEREPQFAAAYLMRADYFAHILFESGYSDAKYREALSEFRESLDQAYETARDPDRRAVVDVDRVLFSNDWTNLLDRMDKALSVDSCVASLWGTELALAVGFAEQAEPFWRRRVACEPLTVHLRAEVASALMYQERPEEALAYIRESISELGAHPWLTGVEVSALTQLGRYDEALESAQGIPADTEFWGLIVRVNPLAASGRMQEARDAIEAWIALKGHYTIEVMQAAAIVGDRELANDVAAHFDARPGGTMILLNQGYYCACGEPFDLEAAPNFAARLKESGIAWPPPKLLDHPAQRD